MEDTDYVEREQTTLKGNRLLEREQNTLKGNRLLEREQTTLGNRDYVEMKQRFYFKSLNVGVALSRKLGAWLLHEQVCRSSPVSNW